MIKENYDKAPSESAMKDSIKKGCLDLVQSIALACKSKIAQKHV